ncbi:MAG TPA: sigma-70 family RNA polymerase sigma factor, partial [Actinomycetota bacterium]|nr:sigma-70 family RNA polymerase sigma factor [Actinomycetota bacterium]
MGAESSGTGPLPRDADRPYGDEAGLAAGLQARDKDALGEAISRYGPSAFGVASRVCRDPQLAEEAAQEAFLTLWRRPGVFDPSRGTLKTLVVSIARNKAIDLVRREESARRVQEPLRTSLHHAEENSPWGDVDLRAHVEWALATLTAPQRDAISLAYFGGRTYREVALELHIPEGTAKTRIRDG